MAQAQLVGKVLALQVWGPKFGPPESMYKPGMVACVCNHSNSKKGNKLGDQWKLVGQFLAYTEF